MDGITIKNLRFRGLHGYFPEERKNGNDFEVDVSLYLSLADAAKSDDLARTVDYNQVTDIVRGIMEGESVKLLETLLYAIGESLARNYPTADKIEVAVRKWNPPMTPSCDYTEVRGQWPKR